MCPDAQIRRLLDAGEDLIAINRVELDLAELFVGQFAVLVDDRVRDTDLPYVVEQPRKVYLFAVLLGFARLPGNLRGVHGHAGRVAVGVFVLGVDGRRQRFCRLFEQVMHVLLFFSVAFNFLLPAALQFAAHVLQGKNVQKRRGRNNGHILQGNAVHKHLTHGGNDGKAGEEQQRNAHVAAQPVEILKNDRDLQKQNRHRNQIGDEEPGRALVAVHLVKGIVQARELGNDDQRHADQGQHLHRFETCGRLFKAAFMRIQVDKIQIEAVNHGKSQKEHEEIADPYHPPAQSACIPSVNVSLTVCYQQKHGGELDLHEGQLPRFRHALRQVYKQPHEAADPAQKKHDVSLVLS